KISRQSAAGPTPTRETIKNLRRNTVAFVVVADFRRSVIFLLPEIRTSFLVISTFLRAKMASNPSPEPEIGPDGLARESPIIAYTEKVMSLSLSRYGSHFQLRSVGLMKFSSSGICVFLSGNCRRAASITQINKSMLLGVERELANLSMEMKLTAGP
ncbi:unnamed protein product, partial [Linum tenue]